jgi:hypothetical protein
MIDAKDVALLHLAALLDLEGSNARLQAWGHSTNWNDLLAILGRLRPQKKFIADFADPQRLSLDTGVGQVFGLLRN